MDQVYDLYGNLEGIELMGLTHLPDSPWDQIWNDPARTGRSRVIPKHVLKRFFEKKDRESREYETISRNCRRSMSCQPHIRPRRDRKQPLVLIRKFLKKSRRDNISCDHDGEIKFAIHA